MGWDIHSIHLQDVVLIGENGEQFSDKMNCVVLNLGTGLHVQYPRSIFRNDKKYMLIKYSEKQDIVFYKLTDEKYHRR